MIKVWDLGFRVQGSVLEDLSEWVLGLSFRV